MALKQINSLSGLSRITDGSTTYTVAQTKSPSSPTLYTTCSPPADGYLNRRRMGQETPHGKKWFIPILNGENKPTICNSNTHIFVQDHTCDPSQPCAFWLAEPQQSPPAVNWNSLLHMCSEEEQPTSLCIGSTPSGGWGVGDPPVTVGYNTATKYGPILTNGIAIFLPDHGSYSAFFGLSFTFSFGSSNPSAWMANAADGTDFPHPPPYNPTTGSCAGQASSVPRTRITGTGPILVVRAQSEGGTGNTFADQGVFAASWFDD